MKEKEHWCSLVKLVSLTGKKGYSRLSRLWMPGLKPLAFIFTMVVCQIFACQSSSAWTLTPMKIEKELKPGETITDVLVVDNSGATDIKRYEVKVVDWTIDEKGDLKYFDPGIMPGSISKDVVCSPMQFKLGPGERKLVRYTLTVPSSATPGEHTLGVQVLEVVIPPKDPETGKINVGVAVKCGFLGAMTVTCPKAEPLALEATGLSVTADDTSKKAKIVLSLENKANVRSRPKWSFKIVDQSGKEVANKDWQDFIILRESKRDLTVELEKPLDAGSYKLVGKLDQGLPYPVQELEKQFEIR